MTVEKCVATFVMGLLVLIVIFAIFVLIMTILISWMETDGFWRAFMYVFFPIGYLAGLWFHLLTGLAVGVGFYAAINMQRTQNLDKKRDKYFDDLDALRSELREKLKDRSRFSKDYSLSGRDYFQRYNEQATAIEAKIKAMEEQKPGGIRLEILGVILLVMIILFVIKAAVLAFL